MWLKKLRRLIRLFFFQLTGKKGDKVAKLTKPIIAVNIDGTVRVLNQDPNATHFNWYTRELLSYNITSPNYDTIVAGTNESKTALPSSSYTNRVYITESYRDIRKFTSFKLYEAGSSAVDVTELYVTKISDFEYSISIPNVEHDYIITWGVGAITYTITSSLTNCVADKSDESYVGGTAVNIVITAATGYTFDSSLGGTIGLSVGEVDKTSEYMARSSDNKKVTIAIPAIAAVGNIIYAAGAVAELPINPDFATATPQELKNAVLSGQATTLYTVGSTRQIQLEHGDIITLRLANNTTDLYERSDGSGTTGFVIEFVDCYYNKYEMNLNDNTNNGGWNASFMRTRVMSIIMSQLPPEWQEVIATVKIKSGNGTATGNVVIESDDKLFLPAEKEISTVRCYSAETEWNALTTWQWYSENNTDDDRVKTYLGSAFNWWERSSAYFYNTGFCLITPTGNCNGAGQASVSYGVAPAFCI